MSGRKSSRDDRASYLISSKETRKRDKASRTKKKKKQNKKSRGKAR